MKTFRNVINDCIFSTRLIGFYVDIPIYLVMCNMKKAYEMNKEYIDDKIEENSCAFVYKQRCNQFSDKVIEFCIFIHKNIDYDNLSEKAKRVIIGHELGHIYRGKNLEFSEEDDADDYSVTHFGKLSKSEAKQIGVWMDNFYNTNDVYKYNIPLRFC